MSWFVLLSTVWLLATFVAWNRAPQSLALCHEFMCQPGRSSSATRKSYQSIEALVDLCSTLVSFLQRGHLYVLKCLFFLISFSSPSSVNTTLIMNLVFAPRFFSNSTSSVIWITSSPVSTQRSYIPLSITRMRVRSSGDFSLTKSGRMAALNC